MEQFVGSDLVLLTLTVGFYCLGSALYSRTKFALLHPVLLGFVAMILYLTSITVVRPSCSISDWDFRSWLWVI